MAKTLLVEYTEMQQVFGGAVTEIVTFEDPAKALPDDLTRDDFLVRMWLGDAWLRTIIEQTIIDVDDEREGCSADEFTETVDRFVAAPGRDSTNGRGMARVMLNCGLEHDAGRLTRASPVRLDLIEESVLLEAGLDLADESAIESLLHGRIDWCAPPEDLPAVIPTGRTYGSCPPC